MYKDTCKIISITNSRTYIHMEISTLACLQRIKEICDCAPRCVFSF